MASENKVQAFVHALEVGGWVVRIRFALLMAAIAAVYSIFIFANFRGISHPKAMDQAQIAREIASGNGFATKFIRPLALWQFGRYKGRVPVERIPDTYSAPLNPIINSFFLRLTKETWLLSPKEYSKNNYIYPSDRVIAAIQMAFFVLSVGVNYLIAKRLFDRRLALLGMGLVLVADVFWQFSLTGLPQMLMLLIFSGCTYMLVRAVEARQAGKPPTLWLSLAAFLFGVLALAHGLTIWIFLGALVFTLAAFRPFGRDALIMLAIFLVVYSPWLYRNYRVCGRPWGLAAYACLYQIRGAESEVMRAMQFDPSGISPTVFRVKVQNQIITQFQNIYRLLGSSLVAPIFFLTLLHLFKRPETALFRWCVLTLWLFAVFGMSVFGLDGDETTYQSNDLHVLFIPLMIFYGLAFVLVLWSRLEISQRLLRVAFLTLIFLISGLPLINTLLAGSQGKVQWPPYVPPFISILNTWTAENEVIASDMPWAVAWYADRRSVWLPATIADFITLSDWKDKELGGPIAGIYLTPITGNQAFVSQIVKGQYKEWAAFIMRNVTSRDFPLRAVTSLPIDNECVFYSDRDRWSEKAD